jgi:hypothetical protein
MSASARPSMAGTISRALATARGAALALGLLFTSALFTDTVTTLVPADIGNLGFISPAQGQPAALTKSQSDARDAYDNA